MSMSGSKIREQVAHFLVDIHNTPIFPMKKEFFLPLQKSRRNTLEKEEKRWIRGKRKSGWQ